jgi:beta-glucanase (GH16 family)
VDARITYFAPAAETYYPGEAVTSSLRLKNTGTEPWNFWVGYSVQDQMEQWYDIAAHLVALDPKEESEVERKTWHVPERSLCISGYYTVAMAVWDAEPGNDNAVQIAYREQEQSFQVLRLFEHFNSFDTSLWKKSQHRLEKSVLNPNNVIVNNGYAKIMIPAGTLNGGELGTLDHFKYGTYRASIMVSDLPGTVTGFFLYNGAGGAGDEIDIEIYNNGDWEIAFTTWSQGHMTNTTKQSMELDPSAGFHEYRIDIYPQQVSFLVDGEVLQRFTSGLPENHMQLIINTWFPDWLSGLPPSVDKYTIVDWIQY